MTSMKLWMVVYFAGVFLLFSNRCASAENEIQWEANFDKQSAEMKIGEKADFVLTIRILNDPPVDISQISFYVEGSNRNIAQVYKVIRSNEIKENIWSGNFTVNPVRPGTVKIHVDMVQANEKQNSLQSMNIIVHRNLSTLESKNALNYLQTMNIALHILLYACFGAALDIRKVKAVFRDLKLGLLSALALDFVLLPLTCVALGFIYLNTAESRMNLIDGGLAGLSAVLTANYWTVLLGGNVDFSIIITGMISLLGFATDAVFLFVIERKPVSIGFLVESEFDLTLIPLCGGLILQYIYPRFAQFSTAILQKLVMSAILCMSFRFLGSDLDIYFMGMFTWKNLLPGLGLVISVYLFVSLWTMALKLKKEDSLTIIIEALDKIICLALVIARTLPGFDPDKLNVFPSSIVIAVPIVLLVHLLWQEIRAKEDGRKTIAPIDGRSFEYNEIQQA